MAAPVEVIELRLIPIPPDTIASAKQELMPLIEASLHEAGRESLLSEKQIQIQIDKTFPTDQAVIIGLTLLSGIAVETYKALILPRLKERFEVKQKSKYSIALVITEIDRYRFGVYHLASTGGMHRCVDERRFIRSG